MSVKILAMAGSLRKDSYNKKLVKNAANGAERAGANVSYIDPADFEMPVYHGDLEQQRGLPDSVQLLQQLMLKHEGFLIASPEYNGSVSGMLKNLIDWTSRPGDDLSACACYRGKVVGIMGTSPGALGAVKNLIHLRTVLSNIGCLVIPNQVAVPFAAKAFDENGHLSDENMRKRIEQIGIDVHDMIDRIKD